MKRLPYVGDYFGKDIYFDLKKNYPIIACYCEDDKKGSVSFYKLWILLLLIFFGCPIIPFVYQWIVKTLVYDVFLLTWFIFYMVTMAILLYWGSRMLLYPHHTKFLICPQYKFEYAIQRVRSMTYVLNGNKMMPILSTIYLFSPVIVTALLGATIYQFYMFYLSIRYSPIVVDNLMLFIGSGILPATFLVVCFLNNPVRLYRVAWRYTHNKIDWNQVNRKIKEILNKDEIERGKLLPIGSIVKTTLAEESILITDRDVRIDPYKLADSILEFTDYAGWMIKPGQVKEEVVFNREDIVSVLRIGAQTEEEDEIEASARYDLLAQQKVAGKIRKDRQKNTYCEPLEGLYPLGSLVSVMQDNQEEKRVICGYYEQEDRIDYVVCDALAGQRRGKRRFVVKAEDIKKNQL